MPLQEPEIDLHPLMHQLRERWRHLWHVVFGSLGLVVLAFAALYAWLLAPPAAFPSGAIVTLESGLSAPKMAAELAAAHVIAHPRVFTTFVRLLGAGGHLQAGPYKFAAPQSVLAVALRIIHGDSGIPLERITLYEGETSRGFASVASKLFPEVSMSGFLRAASTSEGYLFPDTYSFAASANSEQIVDTLRRNFDSKIATLQPQILVSGHSLSDIVIAASIIQAEAATPEDMRLVSGIIWHRLALGMRLQVDAAPETYKHGGLPAAPIDNPGLDALSAAASPQSSKYLYYLTGTDGAMHYAQTYAQHLANIKKYL